MFAGVNGNLGAVGLQGFPFSFSSMTLSSVSGFTGLVKNASAPLSKELAAFLSCGRPEITIFTIFGCIAVSSVIKSKPFKSGSIRSIKAKSKD